MSKLEKKWWFILPVSLLSAMLASLLTRSAGIWPADGAAQWLVYFLCLAALWKTISFLGYLIILFAAPTSKALD